MSKALLLSLFFAVWQSGKQQKLPLYHRSNTLSIHPGSYVPADKDVFCHFVHRKKSQVDEAFANA